MWNQTTFGSIETSISQNRRDIQELDNVDDNGGLDELGAPRRRQDTTDLFKNLFEKNSLAAQKVGGCELKLFPPSHQS